MWTWISKRGLLAVTFVVAANAEEEEEDCREKGMKQFRSNYYYNPDLGLQHRTVLLIPFLCRTVLFIRKYRNSINQLQEEEAIV